VGAHQGAHLSAAGEEGEIGCRRNGLFGIGGHEVQPEMSCLLGTLDDA
jgi:hypothetical protein